MINVVKMLTPMSANNESRG